MYLCTKSELSKLSLSVVRTLWTDRQTDTQTDTQTDAAENIITQHSQVIKMNEMK